MALMEEFNRDPEGVKARTALWKDNNSQIESCDC
jgi:hypothetical protein